MNTSFALAPILGAAMLLLIATTLVRAEDERQSARHFEKTITQTVSLNYLLYLPEGYTEAPAKSWPLVLFLHGAGERGTDLEKVKIHGIPKLIAEGKEFPFIAISPQCPDGIWWDHASTQAALYELILEMQREHRVDSKRIYMTGLSMGGFGTWALATAHPELFAAIAPICGGGQPFRAKQHLSNTPVWIFHGEKDTVVDPQLSKDMYDALKSVEADVQLTLYPEAGHDSWTATYNNPEFYEWMLKQRRP